MSRRQKLQTGLRAVAAEWERVEAPSRVEERLMAAFRAQAGTAVPKQQAVRGMPILVWAGALAAMIAIGVMVVRDRQPAATHRAKAPAVELAMLDNAGEMESAGDGFVPLPGAAQLPPAEDLDLVRVELPRSAMMQVGIEVSPERAAEKVQADVMVGADGLARSVRFLEISGSD